MGFVDEKAVFSRENKLAVNESAPCENPYTLDTLEHIYIHSD